MAKAADALNEHWFRRRREADIDERAHSVEHSTQVKVKKRGSDKKFIAKVLAIGTECDLALLSVEDEKFLKNVTPLN